MTEAMKFLGRCMQVAAAAVMLMSESWSAQAQASGPTQSGNADPLFQQPYVDQDEWRDVPVRHRYVHGGFKGTATRFSFYFPAKDQYQGRFFQYITPVPDNENLSQGAKGEEDKIGFAIDSGAYFIETNGGGAAATGMPGSAADSTIAAYRANAATAQYSRVVAKQMYDGARPYGYAFGGSGGGYRTIGGMENTTGVWDGAVPFVIGSPMAIPNVFTVRMYAQRVLKDKLAGIADAAEVGGSGDMYAGLNDEERAALTEVTKMGFPPRGWYAYQTMGLGAFPVLYPGIVQADPSYFTDFWTKPGYEGYKPPQSLLDARVQHKAKVAKLILAEEANQMGLHTRPQMGQARGTANSAWQALVGPDGNQLPVAIRIDSVPKQKIDGTDLLVNSGSAAGKKLSMQRLEGDIVVFGGGGAEVLGSVKVGDEVQIDNSNFVAAQTYHRHQVPSRDYYVWDQFRNSDGTPKYPQRPMLLGPLFTKSTSGSVNTGKFQGKMIVVENLMDIDALPWQGDWYRNKVKEHSGAQFDDRFRLWYTDRANHGDMSGQGTATQTVSYLGVLHQALRDVSAWVEKGIAPPPSTSYKVVDGQVEVAPTAAARKGIQPVIALTANGAERAEVAVGKPVTFVGAVEVPPGAGKLVTAQWDFEGNGDYPVAGQIDAQAAGAAKVQTTYTFSKPGTYFPTLRVASQRQGDAKTPYARIQNLARVRVVVR